MADERPFYDVLLDYAVFAPIGLVIEAVEELPRLSEKGRERVEKQLTLARLLGRLAVGQVQSRAGHAGHAGHVVGSRAPSTTGESASRHAPQAPPPAGRAPKGRPSSDLAPEAARARVDTEAIVAALLDEPGVAARPGVPVEDEVDAKPAADTLAIPGYDTLAASQVVQRLASLDARELEAIRRYEVATRGRRTILHRITQLSALSRRATA